ncbi:hypothetical protein IFM12275_32610 [Nocardia sputorum]|uniref:LuxR C-terminal-related transcriptional regulator n=1 Tax=Nocardia sputorum TaxID=2984338 RepID=UPI00249189EB|nr:LuxR C-terminal-related transcriptional regulator [Nocardia sputorum]BDT93285.1 hypothetical protein IFM12275_32610 [Nocardia sputorum]
MVAIPDYFPDWLTTMVLGHFPEGDPEAMRRTADAWSDAANALVPVLHRLEAALEQLDKAVEGETGTAMREQYRKIIDQIQAQIDFNNAMARQLYDNATAIEYQQYVIIGIAGALLAQVIIDMAMPPPGSIVKAVADRAEARAGMELAKRDLVLSMLGKAARFVAEHPRLMLATKGVFFGTAIGGGVPYVAQRVQIAQGHREKVDWQQVGIGAAAGAVGGLIGVEVGRRVAPGAIRAGGRVLGTVAAGGVGGMAGGLAGGLTAFGLTGGELRGKDLATMVWTGFGSGLVGSVGASVRAVRAGAYTGAPEPVSSTDPGRPPDAAPPARVSAPGDGRPPQTQAATTEPVSTTSQVDAPGSRRSAGGFGDGSADWDMPDAIRAEGDQILRDLFNDLPEGPERDALVAFLRGDGPGQLPDGSGGITSSGNAPDHPSGGPSHPSAPSSPDRGGSWPAWGNTPAARAGSSVAVAAPPESGPATTIPARQFQISDPQVRPDQQGTDVLTEGTITQPDIPTFGAEVLDGSSTYTDPLMIEYGPAGEMYLVTPEQTTGNATVSPSAHIGTDNVLGDVQSAPDTPPAVSAGTDTPDLSAQAGAAMPKADSAPTGHTATTPEAHSPVVASNAVNSAGPATATPAAATATPATATAPPAATATPAATSGTSHTSGPKPPTGPTPPSGSQNTGPLAGPTPNAHGPIAPTSAQATSASPASQVFTTPSAPTAATGRPGDEPDTSPEEFPTPPGTVVDHPREHNVQKDPREHSVQQDPRDHSVQKKPASDYVTVPGVSYPLEDEPPADAIPVIPRPRASTPLPNDSVGLGRAFENPDDPEGTPDPTSPRQPDIANPLSDRHIAAPETDLDAGLGETPDSAAMASRYATEPNAETPGAPQKPATPRLNPYSLEYNEDPSRLPAIGGVPSLSPAPQSKKRDGKRLVARMGGEPDDKPERRKKQPPPPPPPPPVEAAERPVPTPPPDVRSDVQNSADRSGHTQKLGRPAQAKGRESVGPAHDFTRIKDGITTAYRQTEGAGELHPVSQALARMGPLDLVLLSELSPLVRRRIIDVVSAVENGQELSPLQSDAVKAFIRLLPMEPLDSTGTLTDIEFTELRLVAEDKSLREIGVLIGLKETTVRAHLVRIERKLGAEDRVTAVVAAIRSGILPRTLEDGAARARSPLPGLTQREIQALALVADGRSSPEIAAQLDISVAAVNSLVERAGEMLGSATRAGMVAVAVSTDVLSRSTQEADSGRDLPELTPREIDVLSLVAEGKTSAEIADDLGLTPQTVESYASRINRKLGVGTRAGSVAIAIRTGVIPPIEARAAGGTARPELTPREREVLELVAKGANDNEIAAAVGLTRQSAKTYVSNINQKFGTHHRAGMVAFALRTGNLPLADPAPVTRAELSAGGGAQGGRQSPRPHGAVDSYYDADPAAALGLSPRDHPGPIAAHVPRDVPLWAMGFNRNPHTGEEWGDASDQSGPRQSPSDAHRGSAVHSRPDPDNSSARKPPTDRSNASADHTESAAQPRPTTPWSGHPDAATTPPTTEAARTTPWNRAGESESTEGGFARGKQPDAKDAGRGGERGQPDDHEPPGKPETPNHESAENETSTPKPSSAPDFRNADYADLRAWAAGLSDEDARHLLDRLHADATAHLDALERGAPPPGTEVVATARALSVVMWEQSHRLSTETHAGPIHDYATLFAVSRQLAAQLPTVRKLYAAADTMFTVAGALALDTPGSAGARGSIMANDFNVMHSVPEHLGRSVDKIERSFGSVPWSAESSLSPRSAADPEHRGLTAAAVQQVQGLRLHSQTVRETSGTDWSEFVDEYLTSRSELGFDSELARAMASLTEEAEAFASAQTGSEQEFAVAAAPYLSDLTAVTTHYLTRSRDTGLAFDLLHQARRAFTRVAERLPHWQPAQHAARTMTLLYETVTAAHPELPIHEYARMMRSYALIWLAEPTGFPRSLDQTLRELRRLGTPSTTANAPDLAVDDNVPRRMMSASEFAARLAEAERSGPPVRTAPAHMFTQNSVTELLTYPDGFLVVEKSALTRSARAAEILASAVGHAMEAPVPPVLPVDGDDSAVRMPWLPGITVRGTMDDPGAISAMEALLGHPDADQLGLLDVAINNWDRQMNWMRDRNRLYGYDHAFAFRAPVDPSSSPFSQPYVSDVVAENSEDPYVWLPHNRSRSQIDRYLRAVEGLLPLFEEYQFPEWHPGVVARLRCVRDHARDSASADPGLAGAAQASTTGTPTTVESPAPAFVGSEAARTEALSEEFVNPPCVVGAFADAEELGFDVQQPVDADGPVPAAAVSWLAGAHHERFDGGLGEVAHFLADLGPGAGMLVNARPVGATIGHLFLLYNDGEQIWIHDRQAVEPKAVFDPENSPFTAQTTHALRLTRRGGRSTLASRQWQLGEDIVPGDPDRTRGRALRPVDAGALPPDDDVDEPSAVAPPIPRTTTEPPGTTNPPASENHQSRTPMSEHEPTDSPERPGTQRATKHVGLIGQASVPSWDDIDGAGALADGGPSDLAKRQQMRGRRQELGELHIDGGGWVSGGWQQRGLDPDEAAVAAVRELPATAGHSNPDLTLEFFPLYASDGLRTEEDLEAVATAVADMMRECGWRDRDQIEAASELVRGAGRNAMTYMERYTRALQRSGVEWYEEQTAVQDMKARLMLRMSTQADARSLCVSFDVDQYRPERSPDIRMFTWHAPLFSHAEVGAEVRGLLDSATVSGVEQWGEVWARFDEPRPESSGDSFIEPPPRGDLDTKARIVRKLFDDHRIRFSGWEDPVVTVQAVESVDRALRDRIAEHGSRFALRYFVFDDEIEGFGLTQSFGTTTPDTKDYYVTVTLNKKIFTDPEFAQAWADQVADHRWAQSAEDMIYQVTHHEFIHVVADEGNWALHDLAPAMLRAAHELYRQLDLIPADVGYTEWLALLPHYSLLSFSHPVTDTFDPIEGVAEGARAGAVESCLPLTDPARVLHWLTVTRDGSSPAEFLARWAQRQASGDPDISLLVQDFCDVTGRNDIAIPSSPRPGDTTVDVLAAATGGQPQHFAHAGEIEARLRAWDESPDNRGDGVSALVVPPEGDPYLLVRRLSSDGTTRIELRNPVEGVLRANHVRSTRSPAPPGAQAMFFDETGAPIPGPLSPVGRSAPHTYAVEVESGHVDPHVDPAVAAGLAPERFRHVAGVRRSGIIPKDAHLAFHHNPENGQEWGEHEPAPRPGQPSARESTGGIRITPAGLIVPADPTNRLIVPAAHVLPADPSLEELMERLRPWKEIFSYFWEFPLPREGEPSGREWIESSERKAWMRRRAIRRTPLYAGVDAAVRLTLGAERLLKAPNATPGPATIQQRRVIPGRGETDAEKKRTMHPDAKVREANRADVEEMTAFEKFWRKVSGDELPQTKQIRRGEMAYVGGRLLRAEGHNLMVAGRYAEGYHLMVAGREPVLTPEEYALWLMFSHDALWTVHYPGCRELEPQSPDFLLTRYLTVAIFDKIASKPLEVQYLDDVVRPYLRRQGVAAGRVLLHELSHHLPNSCRSTMEQLGVWALRGLGRKVGAEVEVHLDNCAACRNSAATLPAVDSSLGGRKLLVPPGPAGDGATRFPPTAPAQTAPTTGARTPAPRAGTSTDHAQAAPAQQLDERAARDDEVGDGDARRGGTPARPPEGVLRGGSRPAPTVDPREGVHGPSTVGRAQAVRPGAYPQAAFDPAVALDVPPHRARGLDGLGFDPPQAVANHLGGVPRGLPEGVVAHAANADDTHGALGGGRREAERIASAALSTFRVEATFDNLWNWAARLSDDSLHHLLTGFTDRVAGQLSAIHRGKPPSVTDRVTNPARLLGAIVAEAARRFGDSVPTNTPTTYRDLLALGSWLRANRSTVADLHAGMTAVLDAAFAVSRTAAGHRWSVDAMHHTVPAHVQEVARHIEEAGGHRIWSEEDAFPPDGALDAEHVRLVQSVVLDDVRTPTMAQMVARWADVMDTLLRLRSSEDFSPRYATIFESLPIHALALDRARTGSDRLFAATAATALPHLLDAAFYLLPTSNSALGLDYLRQIDDLLNEATTRFANHTAIYSLQEAADDIHRLYEEIIAADSRRSQEVRARRIHDALSDFFGIGSEPHLHRTFHWAVRALWGLGSQHPGIEYATREHRLDPVLPWDWDITDDERALAATAADLLHSLWGPEVGISSLLRHSDSPDLFEDTFDSVSKNMRWWMKLGRWTGGHTTIGSLLAGATDFSVSQMQLAVLRQYPHIIGAAAGIEYRARDLANRLSLARDLESPGLAPEIRHQLAALREQLAEVRHRAFGLRSPGSGPAPVLLISYDPIAEGGTGRAVISIGEADSASFMAFNVTGTDTLITGPSNWSDIACRQYEEAQRHAPPDARVAIMFTVGLPGGSGAPTHAAGPDTMPMDNVIEARDVAGEIVARELMTYDATRELALDSRDESWSRMVRLSTAIGHGDGIGVLRAAANTLWLDRAVDQIVLAPGSADDRLPTASQLDIGTEHVYTLNPHRDRNGDPNTIGLIMVGRGADIESAPDAESRSAAPLIETPTTVRDLAQLLSAHEYRPLEGSRGYAMTHDEGLTVYRAAQPLLQDALTGTYNTTVLLEDLGLVLRIGRPDTDSYDPRFGPEHRTLPVISRYVRNAPQLLKVLTGRMPDGRVIDESAPILIERLARGQNLAETFRRADRRTIRSHQGLILRTFASIHEQLRAMPEDHPLLDQLTPPGVAKGDTGGWYLNHIDWYTENFYRRHLDRFGHLFEEFGLLRGNPFEPLIDEARSMRESRHHILHADPNEGNFLISNELRVTLLDWELAVNGPSAYDWARLGHLIPGIEVPRELGGPDMVKFARLEKFKRVMNDTVKLAPLAAAGQLTPQLIEFIDTEFSEAVIQVRQLSGHTDLLPPRAELEILRSWRP